MNGSRPRPGAWLAALVFLALLVLWENHEVPSHIEECTDTEDRMSSLTAASYRGLISLSTFLSPNAESVRILTLTRGEEPDELLTNVCLQRHFMARLITKLKNDHVTVITLDKRYSERACISDPSADAELRAAAQSDNFTQVIIGVDADVVPPAERIIIDSRPVCFRLRRHLQFINVKHGLILFDRDHRRVPLEWPVLDLKQPVPTLSLATAEAKDPAIRTRPRLRRILARVEDMHLPAAENPFVRLYPEGTIPASSTVKTLCGSDANALTDWRQCSTAPHENNPYSGNIIFIGDHLATDVHESALGPIFGVDLHANYTAALLSDQIYMPLGDRVSNALGAMIWFVVIQVILFWIHPLIKAGAICLMLWLLTLAFSLVLSHAGYLFMPWLQAISIMVILVSWLEHALHGAMRGSGKGKRSRGRKKSARMPSSGQA
jgi:hypothetical protein